jgi:hypothetical protein
VSTCATSSHGLPSLRLSNNNEFPTPPMAYFIIP